ncbi:hypothetical protein [Mesorhizobium australicum]|uniref:hypothetical protein n=1 Tax=Mesorhizobium australicum TaxID=536018 RepID=UPI00333A6302
MADHATKRQGQWATVRPLVLLQTKTAQFHQALPIWRLGFDITDTLTRKWVNRVYLGMRPQWEPASQCQFTTPINLDA